MDDHISDERVGLPKNWCQALLADTGRYINGLAFKPSDWVDGGLPIIRIQNLTDPARPFNLTLKSVERDYLVERGDILVSWSATLDAFVWQGETAILNQHIFKVVPDTRLVERRFLFYLLRHVIAALRHGADVHGSTMQHINRKPFLTTPVPIPPMAEQQRIVAEIEKHFTRLDAAVAALKRVHVQLKRYRAAVLKAAVEGRLLQPDATPPPLVNGHPENWALPRLGELADIQGGVQKQPKRQPAVNHYPFLRVANVLRNRLDLAEIHRIELFGDELRRLRLQVGDLLVVEGNGSPTEIGRMAVWNGQVEDCVHQNHIIRARLHAGMLPTFVSLYWNSPVGTRRVTEVASSTSGLYTLSVGKLARLPVPAPPMTEQVAIVQEAERQLSTLEQLESEVVVALARAGRLRQSILCGAFLGRLVPQDPEDEPASGLLESIRTARQAGQATTTKKAQRTRNPRPAPTVEFS